MAKTQIDNPNPNCLETHSTFRIISDRLLPDEVTRSLGLTPTIAHAKNDTFVSRAGLLRRPTGVWAIRSEDEVNSTSLEEHLLFVLGTLEPARVKIEFYRNHPDYEVNLLCYWMSKTGHGGPILSSNLLERAARICNSLDFDFYDASDLDE